MANQSVGAESARENPERRWTHARATLEMARVDEREKVDSDIEMMLLGGAQCEARDALLLTDAPNWDAVAYKLEVFRDEECYNLCDEAVHLYLNTVIADIRRLEARHGRA